MQPGSADLAAPGTPHLLQIVYLDGYRTILDTIYSPKNYYQRVIRLLRDYRPLHLGKSHVQPGYVGALFKSILFLGIIGRERFHFWKLFLGKGAWDRNDGPRRVAAVEYLSPGRKPL